MPRVRVLTGTARSDRAAKIDALLAAAPDRSLLIVPTEQHAQRRVEALLRATGCAALLDPPVTTFEGLVRRILRGTELEHARLDALGQHLLLRRVVEGVRDTPALKHLADAARTDGFLDHALSIISQLKQAAIEPEDFAERIARSKRKRPMDSAIAAIYAAYQQELLRARVVDLQGMYWLAHNIAEHDCPPALTSLKHILLDEFDDFTPSEFRVIVDVVRHIEQATFGLNLDQNPRQRDLYAIPLATLERIRETFAGDLETPNPAERPPERLTEYVAASLLVQDDARPSPELVPNIDFIECHTVDHEIETIARRVKRLIQTGHVAPHDIAIVFRHPAGMLSCVESVFGEFGIPLTGLGSRELARTALGGFILRCLDAIQSWSEAAMVDLLISPWLAGPAAPHADAFATLARAARPRPSRHSWDRASNSLSQALASPRGDELTKLARHMPQAVAACAGFRAALDRLFRFADAFTPAASVSIHAAALDSALSVLPIEEALSAIRDPREREQEDAAREALHLALGRLQDDGAGQPENKLPLSEFTKLLRRTFTLVEVNVPGPTSGVAIVGMDAARYLSFSHVFLAGMTDGSVPARAPSNALYAEDERAELRELGMALEDTQAHDRRELLQFHRMFAAARDRLTLSWHRVARGGLAAQRSLYIDEIADRLPGLHIDRPASPTEVMVPPAHLVACNRDLRNLLFSDRATAKQAAGRYPEIAAAVAIEAARQAVAPCGVHDAILADRANLASLGVEYGPLTQFSATALETYAQCPFAFFQERILHLFAVEPTETTLDRRIAGAVLHGALEKFHRRFINLPVSEIDPDTAAAAMRDALDAEFAEHTSRFVHLPRGLRDAEKARLGRTLTQYLTIERERAETNWKPVLFEVAFGRAGDEADAFPLEIDGETVLISGRIDRIDRSGNSIRLIDYKTSNVVKKQIEEGLIVQLAIYALAAESTLCPDSVCDSAIYLAVGKPKGRTVALERGGDKPSWDNRLALAKQAVAESLHGIRAGRFHPTLLKESCRNCAREKVCRYEKSRMGRKAEP